MRTRWVPILIAVLGVLASLGLWVVLRTQDEAQTRAVLDAEAAGVRNEMTARLEARLLAVHRLASRIGMATAFGPEQFQGDAGLLLVHFSGIQAIEWVGADGVVRTVAPRAGNEDVLGFDLRTFPARAQAMDLARASGQVVVTPPIELIQHVPGFAAFAPVTAGPHAGSFASAVFRNRELIDTLLPTEAAREYSVAVSADGQEFYARDLGSRHLTDAWGERESIRMYGVDWDVTLWPTEAYVRSKRSYLPDVVLAAGMGTSVLLATAVHLAGVARAAERAATAAADELRGEVAHRRAAEAALADAVRELERSNRELQDFASVASHDLQEPLRKIQAFGDRLKVKHGPALPPEAQDYLERMQAAAGRMRRLINDLLSFSRVTTRAQPFEPVDLDAVARDVVADLEAHVEHTGGRVEVGPLPRIDADPLQMRQLLQNLIANGLKFHKPEVPPVVRVSARAVPATATAAPRVSEDTQNARDGNGSGGGVAGGQPAAAGAGAAATEMIELLVADNGIGFDEKYLGRIFTVFQRLHGRGEYEGTGIGLAVCRKIAERHGGRITARSRPGEGATFVVALPRSHAIAHDAVARPESDDARLVPAPGAPGEG